MIRAQDYTLQEQNNLYNDFKDAYVSRRAGGWYLDLFRLKGYQCPKSLNHLIFDALRDKYAAKIATLVD